MEVTCPSTPEIRPLTGSREVLTLATAASRAAGAGARSSRAALTSAVLALSARDASMSSRRLRIPTTSLARLMEVNVPLETYSPQDCDHRMGAAVQSHGLPLSNPGDQQTWPAPWELVAGTEQEMTPVVALIVAPQRSANVCLDVFAAVAGAAGPAIGAGGDGGGGAVGAGGGGQEPLPAQSLSAQSMRVSASSSAPSVQLVSAGGGACANAGVEVKVKPIARTARAVRGAVVRISFLRETATCAGGRSVSQCPGLVRQSRIPPKAGNPSVPTPRTRYCLSRNRLERSPACRVGRETPLVMLSSRLNPVL